MQQIIYLDPDDDMTSIRERLNRTQAGRTSLVVPSQSQIFHNSINVKLLRRYSDQYGVTIIVVSRDRITRNLARREGLPVRSSLGKGDQAGATRGDAVGPVRRGARSITLPVAPGLAGRRTKDARPRAASLVGRLLGAVLLLLLLAGLGVGAALFVPEATVTVSPAASTLTQSVSVKANTDTRSVDVARNLLPARLVQSTVEDSATIDATGRKQEPAQKATGSVMFTNRSGAALTVFPGTVVRTGSGSPVRFFTTLTTTVEAGTFAQVPVQAEYAGVAGNVPAWSINQVDGGLSFQVSVINDQPTGGGSEQQAQLVTATDRQLLRDSLFARLQNAAIDTIRNSVAPGDILAESAITVRVEDESFDRNVGDISKTVALRMRVTASALTVAADGMNRLAEKAIEDKLPAGSTLIQGSLKVKPPVDLSTEGTTLTFLLPVSAVATSSLDIAQMKRDLQGQTQDQARQILATRYPVAGDPGITIENDWLDRLPMFAARINVVVR